MTFLFGPDNFVSHLVKMRNSLEDGNSKYGTKLLLKKSEADQSLLYLHIVYTICILYSYTIFSLEGTRQKDIPMCKSG